MLRPVLRSVDGVEGQQVPVFPTRSRPIAVGVVLIVLAVLGGVVFSGPAEPPPGWEQSRTSEILFWLSPIVGLLGVAMLVRVRSSRPPAGWYVLPDAPDLPRYWDGSNWLTFWAPTAAPAPLPPPPRPPRESPPPPYPSSS